MENFIENYVHHRDILVHRRRTRFHVTIFMLPVLLLLLVGLISLTTNRNLFPFSENKFVVQNPLYISPLSSQSHIQVGIGGGPSSATGSSAKK